MATPTADPWPDLPLAGWRGTRDTLHMLSQIAGKTLLATCPAQNHWWHTALRVSARGLASSPAVEAGRSFDLELDLVEQRLAIRESDGRSRSVALSARPVRDFYLEYVGVLAALGLHPHIWTTPVEVPDPVPFDEDRIHHEYDPAAARRFHEVLRRCDAVLRRFGAEFVGKQSPVHFFWGSFDLAATRFSGRRAPERPGADPVTREAYSHEVLSFGFWPGGALLGGGSVDEPIFYAYAAPEPPGFREEVAALPGARYDAKLGEAVLPYAQVRAAKDPGATLLAFCQGVYEAGARLGGWDRAALERTPPSPPRPSPTPQEDAGAPAGA
jgi:hypothetical protein